MGFETFSQENGPEKSAQQPEQSKEKGLTRRQLLRRGAVAGAGAAAAFHLPKHAHGESQEGLSSIEALLERYRETGEIENPQEVFRHMRHSEPQSAFVFGELVRPEVLDEYHKLARRKIEDLYHENSKKQEATPPFERLREALELFFDMADAEQPGIAAFKDRHGLRTDYERPTHAYNRDAASLNDVLVSRRLQCRSGSHFYLTMAVELLPQEEHEKLVFIYTDGHMLPGYQSADGEYTGLEMTSRVKNPPVFHKGAAETLGSFRVVAAPNAALENIAGEKIHPESVVLLEEFDDAYTEETNPDADAFTRPRPITAIGSDTYRIPPEIYAFGEPKIPDGDYLRPDLDAISYKKQFMNPTLPAISAFEKDTKYGASTPFGPSVTQ